MSTKLYQVITKNKCVCYYGISFIYLNFFMAYVPDCLTDTYYYLLAAPKASFWPKLLVTFNTNKRKLLKSGYSVISYDKKIYRSIWQSPPVSSSVKNKQVLFLPFSSQLLRCIFLLFFYIRIFLVKINRIDPVVLEYCA